MRHATPPSKPPRDTESLLWRGSVELRNWIAHSATEHSVSQNAMMTTALLVASLLQPTPKKPLGPPRNILRLLDEIESALKQESLVWGTFHVEDWGHVQGVVETFVNTGLIATPATKTDPAVPDAIAYSFPVLKPGEDVLPSAIAILRPVFAAMVEKEGPAI